MLNPADSLKVRRCQLTSSDYIGEEELAVLKHYTKPLPDDNGGLVSMVASCQSIEELIARQLF